MAIALIAANVVASTFITTLPGMAFAAENKDQGTSVGTQAETKLLSGLKAGLGATIQNTNLLQNPNFVGQPVDNGITSWTTDGKGDNAYQGAYLKYNGSTYITYMDTTDSWNHFTPKSDGIEISHNRKIDNGYIAYIGQDVAVTKGQSYKLSTGYQYISGSKLENLEIRVINYNDNGTVQNLNTSDWVPVTSTTRTNYSKTVTATSSKIRVEFKVIGLGDAIGTEGTVKVFNSTFQNTDQTAPTAPTNTSDVYTNSTTVTGNAEANSTVSVQANGTEIGTAKADANGNYTVTIPKQAYNTPLQITAQDIAGNISDPATTNVKQAPIVTPTIEPLTSKNTTASGTGEPGSTLTFTANGINYTTTVAADGTWSVAIPKQAANTVVEANSVLNGVSSGKANATVTYEGPSTPVLDNVTNKSTKVTGTGTPGNTITLKVKDDDMTLTYTGLVDDFGDFSIPIDTPNAGAIVEAIAKDQDGVLSDKTTTTVLDAIAPDAPTVQGLTDTSTKVIGKGEANCDVTVTLPSGGTITGTTDADGNFSITIPKQAVGKDVSVALTDAAGNKGAATVVTVQADILANPTVNRVSNQDTKVTGTGVAGATVTVIANGKNYTGTVDANGNYEVAIPKLAAGLEVAVQQAKAGKTSGVVKTIVQDDRTPSAPSVNPVKDSDTKATGTGTPGDTITVKLPNGNTASGVVPANGTWSIDIPAQPAGSELDVTATGPNGKTSEPTEVTVAQSPTSGSLTTGDFTIGKDQYIVGTYTGDVKNFRVTIGSKVYTGGSIDPVKHTYTFYATDKAVEGPFTIAALDQYGNVLDTKTANMVKVSTRTPVAPTVNPVKDSDTKATGTGVAGDTITVKTPAGQTYTGVVPANGTWSINIPAQAAGTKLDVTATTPDNKVSPATTVTVAQTPQTGTLTAKDFTVGVDKNITGTFTGDVKNFRVTIGSTVYTGGSVNADGTYSFYALDKITAATSAQTYKIEALDKYGNVLNTKTANIIQNGGSVTPGTGTVTANAFVIHTDKNVTGTLSGDVKSIKLVYDGVTYSGGTISGNQFSFYALDKIVDKSKSARIDGYDANGNKIATSAIALSDSQDSSSTVGKGSVTANDFNVGVDKYITGAYTGDVVSIKVRVDGTTYTGGTLSAGQYNFYASDKITSTNQVVYVDGYDKNGNKIATSIVSVAKVLPATTGTITPTVFKIPADKTLTASYTGDVKSVAVTINGTKYTGGTVSNGTVSFYIGDKITSTSDVVKIEAIDAYARVLDTKNVVIQSSVVIPNTVTPAAFTIGSSYLTGTYSGNVKTVQVKINGTMYSGGTVADGNINFYIGNKVTSTSDSVIIYGYDANGTQVDMKTVTVLNPAKGVGTVTPAVYTTPGDTNLVGTYTGDVKSIIVTVNGTDYTGGTLDNGNFTFWMGTKVTSASDVVTIKGLDANKNIIDTKTVTVKAATPAIGTIAPASFSLKTSAVTGTYTGDAKAIRVTVNGTALAIGGTVTGGNFNYYVGMKNKITSKDDVVKVALIDKNGLVMDEQNLTIVD
ncbi:putative biofilm-associated protein [Listeria weihenstephanensis FSL R9-0317]|uniref:immunoglobulin-like domain-containing protein n=1 Tax=Listeria weihenstephanensis TaxID=1006155 RepID=UPI0003E8BF75|nr:immunoglobulin-like domain-containing protein [Listeria weihenstephanensis]EUJ38269.1 putative biofilm-associated protein [Listeria weihenstephanensis FSL R9-0317]